MKGNTILHLIHIAGTQMIACGIDGLSRGITIEGVMTGDQLLEHVPLHLGCMQRNKEIEPWIRSAWPTKECSSLKHCTPEDWYRGTRHDGYYL